MWTVFYSLNILLIKIHYKKYDNSRHGNQNINSANFVVDIKIGFKHLRGLFNLLRKILKTT